MVEVEGSWRALIAAHPTRRPGLLDENSFDRAPPVDDAFGTASAASVVRRPAFPDERRHPMNGTPALNARRSLSWRQCLQGGTFSHQSMASKPVTDGSWTETELGRYRTDTQPPCD